MTVTFNIRISAHPKRSTKEEKRLVRSSEGTPQKYLFPFTLKNGGVRIQKTGKYKIFDVQVTETKNSWFLQ